MDILIVDDHPIFSVGLREFLLAENSALSVQISSNFKTANELIKASRPNLVLLDLDLGGEKGTDLSKQLLQIYPDLKIAMLTGSESIDDMKACIQAGAIGYVTKSLDPDTLLKAIDLLSSSGSYFPSNLLPYLMKVELKPKIEPELINSNFHLAIFTERQREVLEFLKKGNSNKLIAYELGITEGTVKLHVSSILEKLNVKNRSEAIIKLR